MPHHAQRHLTPQPRPCPPPLPLQVHAAGEVEAFSTIASALVINLGTLSDRWVEGLRLAAGALGIQEEDFFVRLLARAVLAGCPHPPDHPPTHPPNPPASCRCRSAASCCS